MPVPLLVTQEQVLDAAGRDRGPMLGRVLAGEHRRMVVAFVGNAECVERRKHRFGMHPQRF